MCGRGGGARQPAADQRSIKKRRGRGQALYLRSGAVSVKSRWP
jgi:hypothetical protein